MPSSRRRQLVSRAFVRRRQLVSRAFVRRRQLVSRPESQGGKPVGRSVFRPDIEGLRALAVGLVIANHLGWLGGGFIGVDVFFVISGYLITRLLVSEVERTGRISFLGFYRRRARRILPAAIAVLIATNLAAHLVFLTSRAQQTAVDSWWALGFLANVHFASVGTDYFQAGLPPSLVQHYWSLSVEEQFYVVWPVLLLLVAVAMRRWLRETSVRVPLTLVLAVGTALSFWWSVRQSAAAPTDAYFATPARAWELGAGALIALSSAVWARLPGWLRPLLALGGLAAIAVSAVDFGSASRFPAPAGALPVLGAAAIIGAASTGWTMTPLTNPVSRYVGRVSYSLYLWHWPTILTIEALVPRTAAVFWPMLACTLAGLTVASYHLIETPFRTGSIWRVLRRRPRLSLLRPGFASLTALACAVAVVALYQGRPPATAPTIAGSADTVHHPESDPTVAPVSPARAAKIKQAVAATSIPDLDPPLATLGYVDRVVQWNTCLYVGPTRVNQCTFGSTTADAAHTMVLLGDSEALNWVPALQQVASEAGWRLQVLTLGECPAFQARVLDAHYSGSFVQQCLDHVNWTIDFVRHLNPGLVILTSSEVDLPHLASQNLGDAAVAEWSAGLRTTLAELPDRNRAVVVSPAPWALGLPSCAPTGKDPGKCVATPNALWQQQQQAEESAAQAAGVRYVDTHLWFCTDDGLCPDFVGTTSVRWDNSHLTQTYAVGLANEFSTALDLGKAPP